MRTRYPLCVEPTPNYPDDPQRELVELKDFCYRLRVYLLGHRSGEISSLAARFFAGEETGYAYVRTLRVSKAVERRLKALADRLDDAWERYTFLAMSRREKNRLAPTGQEGR